MKRISILILAFFAIVSAKVYSQDLFYADEAYDKAVAAAAESLDSPQLVMCMSLQMNESGMAFPFEFDWETGKATAWIYYFVDKDDHEKHTGIFSLKVPIVGIFVMEQDIDSYIGDLGSYSSFNGGLTKSQVNSSRMAAKFSTSENFKNEKNMYEDDIDIFISLFTNVGFPGLEENKTYWGVIFDPDISDSFCSMEVETEDIFCSTFSDVEEITSINKEEIQIKSNPVDDVLSVELPKTGSYTVSIIDFLGNEVISEEKSLEFADIDVSNLSSGAYFIQIRNGNNIQSQKFIKR